MSTSLEQYLGGFGADGPGGKLAGLADAANVTPQQLSAVVAGLSGMTGKGNTRRTQFSVRIRRTSANIAAQLPVPLFGPVAYEGGYAFAEPPPPGITRTIARTGVEEITITFSSGENTDTVVISGQYAYVSMKESLRKRELFISEHKYTVTPEADAETFFSNPLKVVYPRPFGAVEYDTFLPGDATTEGDFRKNIVTVLHPVALDDIRFLVLTLPAVSNFTVAMACKATITE